MSSWHSYFERARAAMQLKRWSIAHEEILKALAEDPEHALLHATRAEICCRQDQFKIAREAAREAISKSPDSNVGYFWLAWSLISDPAGGSSRAVDVVQIADRALECDPDDPDSHYLRAEAARFAGNLKEVVSYAESGLQIDPEHIGCLETLGRLQTRLERDDQAEATLRRLLQIRPESIAAHQEMARVALRSERFAEAYEHASTAVRREPNSAELRELYAEVVRHQHPLARFFLWSAKPWEKYPILVVPFALVPLLSLKPMPKHLSGGWLEAVWAVLGFFFCLGFAFYGAPAIAAAQTIIAHSARFSSLVPETHAVRSIYAFAWVAGTALIVAALISAFFLSPHPFLLVGNAVICGVVALIAKRAPNKEKANSALRVAIIPVGVQLIAWFWSPPEMFRGSMPGIVLGCWLITIALAAHLSGKHGPNVTL